MLCDQWDKRRLRLHTGRCPRLIQSAGKTMLHAKRKAGVFTRLGRNMRKHPLPYLMALVVLTYFALFCYWPMYGNIVAFKKYKPFLGMAGSKWIGLENFTSFFTSYYFVRIMRNTLILSLLNLVIGFPVPILFAILLNEVRSLRYKKLIQTATYLPHFISTVIICSMVTQFTNSSGFITAFVNLAAGHSGSLIGDANSYRAIYVASDIWAGFGWGSILYIAAMTGIDPTLYEAATIDGASKGKQIWHITLPGIKETIVIMFILACGRVMSVGWEKSFLLQSPLTYETSDIISTFVYRKGFEDNDYGYSAAVNMFNSVINLILLVTANRISRKLSDSSLW
jgi:putative aldouronate transport system permease protein